MTDVPKNLRKDNFDSQQTMTMNKNESKPNSGDKIKNEIDRLLKQSPSGRLTQMHLNELYTKYKEDQNLLDEILKAHAKNYKQIQKTARSFAEKIYQKYMSGVNAKPYHEIINRMVKYKNKKKWSDMQYAEFVREFSRQVEGSSSVRAPESIFQNINARSRISRTLGTNYIAESTLNIKSSEQPILAEILSLHDKTLNLYNTMCIQTLVYSDMDIAAISGEFKREKHIGSVHIHPIFACFYLPKFEIIEIHTILGNIGGIIKAKHSGSNIITEPNTILMNAMSIDPNDIVCDSVSPITDIRNRFRVQTKLWPMIQNLRNGLYYESYPMNEFLNELNACRNNVYDNADLAFNQDEGAITRRFLSVFSLRPTIVATKPLNITTAFMASTMFPGLKGGAFQPFINEPVYTITTLPMITVNIPGYYDETTVIEPKDLSSALKGYVWISENKVIVPKEQSVIYSNEILIFYVNRRVQRYNFSAYISPLYFSQLPLTVSSFQKLNRYPVHAQEYLQLREGERFMLRSVVAVTETTITKTRDGADKPFSIITGSVGLLTRPRGKLFPDMEYLMYDPFGASQPIAMDDKPKCSKGHYTTNKPVSVINGHSMVIGGDNDPENNFFEIAKTRGTIFIYAKSTGYTAPGNMYI